jgi:hypothetical protein
MMELPPVLRTIPEAGFDNMIFGIPHGAVIICQVNESEAEDIGEDVISWYGPQAMRASCGVRDRTTFDLGDIGPASRTAVRVTFRPYITQSNIPRAEGTSIMRVYTLASHLRGYDRRSAR